MIRASRIAFPALAAALAACGGAGAPTAAAPADPACAAAASLSLAPGEVRGLTEAEAACFRLAAGDGAEYALAGFDARALDASAAGTPGAAFADPHVTVADRTYGGGAGASASLAARPAAAPAWDAHARSASGAPGDPFARATPWREGERFAVKPLAGTGTVPARVVRVVDGRWVLAVVEGDEEGAARVLDQAEDALAWLAAHGAPLLRAAYPGAEPATSRGSGQVLVLASAWDPAQGAAAAWSHADESGAYTFVWLNLNLRPGYADGFEMYDHVTHRLKVLAHEMTHAWQTAWLHGAHGAAGRHAAHPSAAWAREGGADFVAMDLVRRYLGVGAASNWRWADHLRPQTGGVVYALEPADARGRVTHGYYDAASLLRDLQMRLVDAGMTPDAAMAELARGAVEGWHGADGDGGGCAGLVERVRARLGAAWDPAGAVLLWTLSQAADDRTSNPRLSNPTYHDVARADDRYGWKPAGELRAGGRGAVAFAQTAGGSFFVRLRGAAVEGTLSASSAAPGTRWMIARVR